MAYRCNSGQFPYFGKEWGSRKGRVYKRMKRSEVKVNIPNPYNQLKYEFGVHALLFNRRPYHSMIKKIISNPNTYQA